MIMIGHYYPVIKRSHRLVQFQEFLRDLEARGAGITPWFRLCTKELLPFWWRNLDRLEEISDNKIHNFYGQ